MDPTETFQDPRQGMFLSRTVRGGGYLLRGYRFVFREHPELLRLCLAPLLINLLLFVGGAAALVYYWNDIIAWVWARPEGTLWQALWYVLYVFMAIIVLLMGYMLFFALQGVLSAPFNDLISERVEKLAFGLEPLPFEWGRFTRGLATSLFNELRKQSVYLLGMGALLLIKVLVPVAGPLIFLIGGFVLSANFFCYDFMDFSMARREMPWSAKMALMRGNRMLTLGFGAALAGAMAVPVLGSLTMPMAAVGGTLLFCDLDRAGSVDSVL